MWIFTKDSLLMPATFPKDKVPAAIANRFEIQVRSRSYEQLEKFCADYMRYRTYSKIQSTPHMDYEYRFYTTKAEFAAAVRRSIEDIDYEKFKPEATEPVYHAVLNRIWSVVAGLGLGGSYDGDY